MEAIVTVSNYGIRVYRVSRELLGLGEKSQITVKNSKRQNGTVGWGGEKRQINVRYAALLTARALASKIQLSQWAG